LKMLLIDDSKRYSASELLKHSLFEKYNVWKI
jgi:hypothetical protein